MGSKLSMLQKGRHKERKVIKDVPFTKKIRRKVIIIIIIVNNLTVTQDHMSNWTQANPLQLANLPDQGTHQHLLTTTLLQGQKLLQIIL